MTNLTVSETGKTSKVIFTRGATSFSVTVCDTGYIGGQHYIATIFNRTTGKDCAMEYADTLEALTGKVAGWNR